MTADCFFSPDNPNCAPSTFTVSSNEDTHLYKEGLHPWLGQITYTMIAAQALTFTCVNMFKWKKNEFTGAAFFGYQGIGIGDAYLNETATLYKKGKLIYEYGWLILWSVALLTQLMSDFGVGA